MRIFIGLGDSWGYYPLLQRGFKNIGVSSTFVNAFPNETIKINHDAGVIGKLVEWLGYKRVKSKRNTIKRHIWTGLQGVSLLVLLISTLLTHNVYIFASGTSFLAGYDYWLLKLLRKRIIIVFHGSDSRAPYISGLSQDDDGNIDIEKCILETNRIKKKLVKLEKYADVIINHPMSSHLHEKELVNWLSMGIPYSPSPNHRDIENKNKKCTILHAPSRPLQKGTPVIEKALSELNDEGFEFFYIKLTGKTNQEVLENIAECDFVVDELYSDLPMASFATEAASFGKPAIVGIYEYKKVEAYIHDKSMIPPVYVCDPNDVKSAIRKLIVDTKFREDLGSKAKKFISEKWYHDEVAKRYLLLAKGEIPSEWFFSPRDITRLYGWGMNDESSRKTIGSILFNYDIKALSLSNNKKLEKLFIKFSSRE